MFFIAEVYFFIPNFSIAGGLFNELVLVILVFPIDGGLSKPIWLVPSSKEIVIGSIERLGEASETSKLIFLFDFNSDILFFFSKETSWELENLIETLLPISEEFLLDGLAYIGESKLSYPSSSSKLSDSDENSSYSSISEFPSSCVYWTLKSLSLPRTPLTSSVINEKFAP